MWFDLAMNERANKQWAIKGCERRVQNFEVVKQGLI